MSDTPRTDDEEMSPRLDVECMIVSADFARQLERELAEARKQSDRLAEAMTEMWPFIEKDDAPACNTPAFNAAIAKYKASLAAVKGGDHE
jgi:hypothetical protein